MVYDKENYVKLEQNAYAMSPNGKPSAVKISECPDD